MTTTFEFTVDPDDAVLRIKSTSEVPEAGDDCVQYAAYEVTGVAAVMLGVSLFEVIRPGAGFEVGRFTTCPDDTAETRDAALAQRIEDAAVAEGRY